MTDSFVPTATGLLADHDGLEAIILLPEVEATLSLADVYESVEFQPEPADDEAV